MTDIARRSRQILTQPVTRMATRRDTAEAAKKTQAKAAEPRPEKVPHSINLGQVLHWVVTVGRPDDVTRMHPYWLQVNLALARLGVRGNSAAVKELPEGLPKINFNGGDLAAWLAVADMDDLDALQKIYATMRLRVRLAKWLKRKR